MECEWPQWQWTATVIYPYTILNSTLNFHSYFTLRCFQCLPIPYSDISNVFHTLTFSYSALWCFWCFPQSSDIFLHSDVLPTPIFPKSSCSIPCSDVFRCFPYFYRCGTFSELLWAHYHHGTFSVTSQTIFSEASQSRKHHGLFMDAITSASNLLNHGLFITCNLLYSTLYLLLHRYPSPLV